MQLLTISLPFAHVGALDAALTAALGSKYHSANIPVGTGGMVMLKNNDASMTNGTGTLYMDDTALPADDTVAQNIATAHDPALISVDKPTIKADNIDAATITVSAPKANAAPVTLLIGGNPVVVTMSGGVGTITLTAVTPTIITVSVQNPANRSTDSLRIEAI